jgi:hypothetical protein
MSQDCLSGLALLSVEKLMTENIIKFHDKATDKSSNHKGHWIFHKNKKLLHILINVFTKTLKVCSFLS